MTNEVPRTPFCLTLVGGSFQGKSLVAVRLADRLGMPHVLSTDVVRNILSVQHVLPPPWLGTSTYRLTEEELDRQCAAVSRTSDLVVKIFARRGESAILEGMHFSKGFIGDLGARPNVLLVGLDNLLAYEARIRTKVKATRRQGNLRQYEEFRDRIESIHRALLQSVADANGFICRYKSLDEAVTAVSEEAHRRFRFVGLRQVQENTKRAEAPGPPFPPIPRI